MGKSTNGPAWVDVEGLMRAIEAAHGGKCGCLLSPDGIGATGGFTVNLLLEMESLPGSELQGAIGVEQHWPCREHAELVACVFAGLYRLDFAIAQAYKQTKIEL
jgi:hypothetical protein